MITGSGNMFNIVRLVENLERQLDIEFSHLNCESTSLLFGTFEIKNINVLHGQKEERTSQESSEETSKIGAAKTSCEKATGENYTGSNSKDGRRRSCSNPISTTIYEYCRSLRADVDRQQIYRRRDGKLNVDLFEFFRYFPKNLDLNFKTNEKNFYICESFREDFDLRLVIDFPENKNFLIYPKLKLAIDFADQNCAITIEGFYLKMI